MKLNGGTYSKSNSGSKNEFTPKGKGGIGHAGGIASSKPSKASVTLSTDQHKAQMRKPYLSGGSGSAAVSTHKKSGGPSFGTFKSVPGGTWRPTENPKVA
jgi:hypothetical protein